MRHERLQKWCGVCCRVITLHYLPFTDWKCFQIPTISINPSQEPKVRPASCVLRKGLGWRGGRALGGGIQHPGQLLLAKPPPIWSHLNEIYERQRSPFHTLDHLHSYAVTILLRYRCFHIASIHIPNVTSPSLLISQSGNHPHLLNKMLSVQTGLSKCR